MSSISDLEKIQQLSLVSKVYSSSMRAHLALRLSAKRQTSTFAHISSLEEFSFNHS
jgi:hypothetical protein